MSAALALASFSTVETRALRLGRMHAPIDFGCRPIGRLAGAGRSSAPSAPLVVAAGR